MENLSEIPRNRVSNLVCDIFNEVNFKHDFIVTVHQNNLKTFNIYTYNSDHYNQVISAISGRQGVHAGVVGSASECKPAFWQKSLVSLVFNFSFVLQQLDLNLLLEVEVLNVDLIIVHNHTRFFHIRRFYIMYIS